MREFFLWPDCVWKGEGFTYCTEEAGYVLGGVKRNIFFVGIPKDALEEAGDSRRGGDFKVVAKAITAAWKSHCWAVGGGQKLLGRTNLSPRKEGGFKGMAGRYPCPHPKLCTPT